MTFESLPVLHAVFVAGEFGGDMLEPARRQSINLNINTTA